MLPVYNRTARSSICPQSPRPVGSYRWHRVSEAVSPSAHMIDDTPVDVPLRFQIWNEAAPAIYIQDRATLQIR